MFIGLSKGNILSQDMVKSMASDPIVFALANPDPEIPYEDAIAARPDIITVSYTHLDVYKRQYQALLKM